MPINRRRGLRKHPSFLKRFNDIPRQRPFLQISQVILHLPNTTNTNNNPVIPMRRKSQLRVMPRPPKRTFGHGQPVLTRRSLDNLHRSERRVLEIPIPVILPRWTLRAETSFCWGSICGFVFPSENARRDGVVDYYIQPVPATGRNQFWFDRSDCIAHIC